MTPWLADPDVRLFHGDALEVLRELPDGSVHMCATSPPFWNLRDYNAPGQIGLEATPEDWTANLVAVFREVRRVLRDDGTLWVEIGDSYAHGQPGGGSVFDNGRTDGRTSYEADKPGGRIKTSTLGPGLKPKDLLGQPWLLAFALRADGWYLRSEIIWARPNPMPESVTDRCTKSHSTVFLLSKRPRYFFDADAIREAYADHRNGDPGPARTSITDTLASGSRRFDHDTKPKNSPGVVRPVPQSETLDGSEGEAPRGPDGRRVTTVKGTDASEQHRDGERWPNPAGANARSVWTIPTEPTPFAHFATFPQALVRRMILAGTSERGACPECGAPWVRETERRGDGRAFQRDQDQLASSARRSDGSRLTSGTGHRTIGGTTPSYLPPEVTTTGWRPTCACSTETPAGSDALSVRGLPAPGGEETRASDLSGVPGLHGTTSGWSPSCACKPPGSEGLDKPGEWEFTHPPVPCTVLDPFAGSGTTSLVARNHGRHSIGIELNESYLEIAAKRLQQLSLLSETYSAPAEDGDSHRKETEQSAF